MRKIELTKPKSIYFSSPWIEGSWARMYDQKRRVTKNINSSRTKTFQGITLMDLTKIKRLIIEKIAIVRKIVSSVNGKILRLPRIQTE